MTPKLITPDNRIIPVQPANGTHFTLEEAQGLVGGNVEILYPPSNTEAILVINEEGKLLGLPVNKLATQVWLQQSGQRDYIVGNAILMPSEYFK